MAVFPITRAPTSAVSSPVTRLAGLSQGRSRITERSPVTGSPRPRRLLWVCDPAGRSGRGATFAPKSRIGDVWSATLPQSDKGRVARNTAIEPSVFAQVHENRWIFWLAPTRARPTRGELHARYGQRRQDKIGSHQLDKTFLQQAAETQFSGRRLQAKDSIANNFA